MAASSPNHFIGLLRVVAALLLFNFGVGVLAQTSTFVPSSGSITTGAPSSGSITTIAPSSGLITTGEPTIGPQTHAPSEVPTIPTYSPTLSPTVFLFQDCNTFCEEGYYNLNLVEDVAKRHCPSQAEVACEICQGGTYKEDTSVFTGCLPCDPSDTYDFFCNNGKRYQRQEYQCTYASKEVQENSNYDSVKTRDKEGSCGELVISTPNIDGYIAKPTDYTFKVSLTNVGDIAILVNDWSLPEWLKIKRTPGSPETNDVIVHPGLENEVDVQFIIRSAIIPTSDIEKESSDSFYGSVTERITYSVRQEFVNPHIQLISGSFDLSFEITDEAKLSVLPSSYSIEMPIFDTAGFEIVLDSEKLSDITWYANIIYPGSEKDWLSLDLYQGTLLGYVCKKTQKKPDTPAQYKEKQNIKVSVDSTTLKPGMYSATIGFGQTESGYHVNSYISLRVFPGPLVYQGSTWKFDSTATTYSSSTYDVPLEQYNSLEIVARDVYGVETNTLPADIEEDTFVFEVSWMRISDNENTGSVKVKQDIFTKKFKAALSDISKGTYTIEIKSIITGEQIQNSPFNVTFLPRKCAETENTRPDLATGTRCVCSPGYGRRSGNTACSLCPVGRFRSISMINDISEACELCPLGTFQDETGSESCKFCPLGSEPNEDRSKCEACKPNQVVNEQNPSRTCEYCNPDYTVLEFKCVCRPDYYELHDGTCAPCPEGAYCGYGKKDTIFPLKGYWRSSWDELIFLKCTNEDACMGLTQAEILVLNTAEGWEQFTSQSANLALVKNESFSQANSSQLLQHVPNISNINGCNEGYTGNLCHQCEYGFVKVDGLFCEQCPARAQIIGVFILFIFLGIVSLLFLIRRAIQSRRETAKRQIMVLKIVISHFQVIAMVQYIPFQWPSYVHRMISTFDTVSSAGASVLSTACLISEENSYFIVTSATYLFLPLVFITAFGIYWFFIYPFYLRYLSDKVTTCLSKCEPQLPQKKSTTKGNTPTRQNTSSSNDDNTPLSATEAFMVSNIVLLFVMYPLLTTSGLQFFSCSQVTSDRQFLEADYSILCWSDDHTESMWIGISLLVVYALGIPLLLCFVIFSVVRPTLRSLDRKNIKVYGFLYRAYRDEYNYWELVIMLRKSVFACVTVILIEGEHRAYLGLLVIIISFILHIQAKPYKHKLDLHKLEMMSLAVLFFTVFGGLFLLSIATPTGTKESISIMVVLLNGVFVATSIYVLRNSLRKSLKRIHKQITEYLPQSDRDNKKNLDDLDDTLQQLALIRTRVQNSARLNKDDLGADSALEALDLAVNAVHTISKNLNVSAETVLKECKTFKEDLNVTKI